MLNTITLKRVFAACTALVICASSLVTPAYADETTITAATVESDAASTCTISFDTAGGSYVASQTINAGAKITKPQDPTQKGMTFLGWFMNPYNIIDGVTTVEALKPYMFNFDSEIYGSFTLTALWGAQLNLTATEGGEVTSCFIDETLSYAGKKTAAETAIIGFYDTFYIGAKASDGYKFSKWQEKHADGSYEDFWNESEVFMTMNKTLELVAIFEEIGKKEEEQPKQPEEPTEPEKPEEPTEPEKPEEPTEPEKPSTYVVAFETNGGNTIDSQTVESGKLATEPSIPTKEGYTFDGWYTNSKFTEKFFFSNPITSDTLIYAKWNKNDTKAPEQEIEKPTSYTISYELDGGSILDGENPTSYTSESEDFTLINPVKEGYTFIGWTGTSVKGASKEVTIAKGSTGNREYVAIWVEGVPSKVLTNYTISYDLDGGTVEGENPTTYTEETEDFTLVNPTKEGYTFIGWTGTGIKGASKEVTIPSGSSGDKEFVAIWTESPTTVEEPKTYTVSFDSNGGSEVTSQTIEEGNKASKPENPTREGLNFLGWFVNPTTIESIVDSETMQLKEYSFDEEVNSDITLTALWSGRLSVKTKSLGQVAIAGEGKTPEFDEYPVQDIIETAILGLYDKFTVAAKPDDGYKFVKWEKLVGDDQYEDFSTESQINVTVENNLTITAVFEKEETEVPTTPDTPAITKVNPTLQLKAVVKNNAKKQTSIATLSWKAVKGASYYEVYGKFADSEEYSLLTTIKTKTCKISLEFGNAYAAKIKAVAANGYVLEESLDVYFIAGTTDESNAKSIISANVKVGMGRTTQIASAILPTEKGKTVFGEKYVNLYRYYSSDTSIAEVDDYGTVTAKAVGKVTIFLYAPNGVMKKITVNVVSNMLMLKATVKNSSNATISWNNVAGATAYDVYLAQYGIALEKVATFDSNVKMCNIAQLEAEKEYACIVHALDANGNIIAESNFVHFVASSSAKTNAKKVTASSVSITVNGTAMIIATVAPAEKNKTAITDFTYFSLQPNVATVDKNGIVTGLAKGKATIYVFAANGVYKTIKVTVK